MEFGMLGVEGLVSSSSGFVSLSSSDHGKQKCCGSAGFLKQERAVILSHDNDDDDEFKASKIAKVRDDLSASKASSFVFSDDGQQENNMLSFSSPKLEDFSLKCSGDLDTKNLQKSAFPIYFQHPSQAYSKISGYSCTGGVNASMYLLSGVKGPFTPAQWLELEHQALIYKYIIANEPIPPTLLIPIRRALESAATFFSFPGGLLRPNSFGWGPFHLGFSHSTDPEPGRCRRTDGKKWRCSREAMPDQKYCERHMNRGRHRSRKPVEGQKGHSFSGSTPITKLTNTSPNLMNVVSSSATLVVPGAGASDSFTSDHPTSSLVNRLLVNKQNSSQEMQHMTGLSFLPPAISLNSSSNASSIAKDHIRYAESTPTGFGVLTSDPLCNTYVSSHDLNPREPDSFSQQSTRPFMGDFMSSTSSSTEERVPLSTLRLSGQLEMGLGVGSEQSQKQSYWVPISWETSMGGPLGEALKTTNNGSDSHSKNVSSSLNLLSKGWEGSPPMAASSPTGVLQRTPLGSLSNSSAGSSPGADYGRAPEGGLAVHTACFTLGS